VASKAHTETAFIALRQPREIVIIFVLLLMPVDRHIPILLNH